MKTLLLSLAGMAGISLAAEPVVLPLDLGTFKTIDNKVYEGAKVVGSDAVGIKLVHDGGTARITYDRLPRDLAAKFNADPEAAKAQLAEEAANAAAHEREIQVAMKEQQEGENAGISDGGTGEKNLRKLETESFPDPAGKETAERIYHLQMYVIRMKGEIDKVRNEIERKNAAADKVTASAYSNSGDKSVNVSETRLRRAQRMRSTTKEEIDGINAAETMIRKAEAEIELLKASRR